MKRGQVNLPVIILSILIIITLGIAVYFIWFHIVPELDNPDDLENMTPIEVIDDATQHEIEQTDTLPSCTDECSARGLRRCFGNGYKVCGNYDEDSCYEWSSKRSCSSGKECSSGRCVEIEDDGEEIIPENYVKYDFDEIEVLSASSFNITKLKGEDTWADELKGSSDRLEIIYSILNLKKEGELAFKDQQSYLKIKGENGEKTFVSFGTAQEFNWESNKKTREKILFSSKLRLIGDYAIRNETASGPATIMDIRYDEEENPIGFLLHFSDNSQETEEDFIHNLNSVEFNWEVVEEEEEIEVEFNCQKIKELIPNHNNKNADRINLVFLLFDFTNETIAKEWVRKNLAFDDGKMVDIYPEHDYLGKDGQPVHNPEQIVLQFGAFSMEPFKSNKNKFNFWYVIVDLENNEARYENFLGDHIFRYDIYRNPETASEDSTSYKFPYLPSCDLDSIHPIIITSFLDEDYKYIRQNARLANFRNNLSLTKSFIKFGYFFDSVEIDNKGQIIGTSGWETNLVWTHEMGHSLFGLRDEYVEEIFEEDEEYVKYGFPNCAHNMSEAQEWWGDLIGQVDSTYYELVDISDEFYQQYKTENNSVSVPSFDLCSEENLMTDYIKGGCFGSQDADVFRPTEQSLMHRNCPILGSVNRRRAEQVLDLFTGE